VKEVNHMLRLKGCPRCKGDLHTDRDIYGTYTVCLQCGYMVDLQTHDRRLAVAIPRAKKQAA